MMKRVIRLVRRYYWFSVALLSVAVGLGLELTKHHSAAYWLLGVVAILETFQPIWNTWQDLRLGKYGANILPVITIITAVILGQYWAAIVIALILTGNKILTDQIEKFIKKDLNTLAKLLPKTASALRKGKTVETKVSELNPGDKLIIKTGDRVPVDAILIEGVADFDESLITGEGPVVPRQVGDQLLSGSVNLGDAVTVRASAPAHDSYCQQIVRLAKSAAGSQAPFTRLAELYSLPFTILVLGIAVAAWVLTSQAIRFLEVMTVATAYPLLAAIPLSLTGGLVKAISQGIIAKTGRAFEALSRVRTAAFNKTGTLTQGWLTVDTIKTYGPYGSDEILRLAASLEQTSDHAVAKAIVRAAEAKQLKLVKPKHIQTIPNRGLKATVKGQRIIIGQPSLLEESIELPAKLQSDKSKQTAVYIAQDDSLIAVISFKDELRPEAEISLSQLQQLGVTNTVMLTSDSQAAAQTVAEPLDIKEIHASLLPADKIHAIENLKPRPVVFVGNSPDDSLAMNAANIGLALGAQNLAGINESADIILTNHDLSHIPLSVALSKRSLRIARQSCLAGMALSLALMLVFATGKLSPLTGVFLQQVINIYVILNALRARF